MELTTWQAASRVIPPKCVREFYDTPLAGIRAFLFETSRLQLPRHGGSASLKLVLSGREDYFIGRRTVRLRPGEFLLVNAGESYASRISSRTRSRALFFPDRDRLPEMPQVSVRTPAPFRRWLGELLRAFDGRHAGEADEAARLLLGTALEELRLRVPHAALTQVRKPSTRHELVARVLRAREYMDDMRGIGCPLDRLAEIACLSKYHFLRVFRDVHGCGPAAYARARRVESALDAIRRGSPRRTAAGAAGYSSYGALLRAAAGIARQRRAN